MTRYKLLALDVDGTLVGTDSRVSPLLTEALRRAQDAGLRVCLATGRSYIETIGVWRQLGLPGPWEPLVLVGGALVSEPDTGRTLYHKPIGRALAQEFAEALGRAGLASMAIVDAWRHGIDYLLVETGDVHEALAKWFSKMNVKVRRVGRLDEDGSLPPPLRISAVVEPAAGARLADQLAQQFDQRLNVHSILAPNYGVTIVEAFARGASKQSGLLYVAQAMGAAPRDVVAVGDDVNDLPMVRWAGLGAAMGHGQAALRESAKHIVKGELACFVDRVITGQFD